MNGKLLVLRSQNKSTRNQEIMEVVQNIVLDVNYKIINQLQEGQFQINKTKLHFNKQDQNKQIFNKSKSVPHLSLPVSTYSAQDKLMMKQMMRRQREYQQTLQINARQLQESVIQDEELQKIRIQQQRKRKFQENKQKAKLGIQQIKQRHEKRIQRNHQQNFELKHIKQQKKLYEKLMEKWNQIQQQQQQQKIKLKQKLAEQKKISFDEIKQHAVKHDETLSRFKQSRISASRISQHENKKFYQSTFMIKVCEQNKQTKQQYQKRLNFGKQMLEKRIQYAENVRQNYKPAIKQIVKQQDVKPLKISKSLSYFQTRGKGNNYMKEINSKLDWKLRQQSKNMSISDQKNNIFKYKNYLTQMRIKKDEREKELRVSQKLQKQRSYQNQIKKIMNKTDLNESEKFIRAKLFTKKIEASSAIKKNPFKIIDSINAKIQILKHVSK